MPASTTSSAPSASLKTLRLQHQRSLVESSQASIETYRARTACTNNAFAVYPNGNAYYGPISWRETDRQAVFVDKIVKKSAGQAWADDELELARRQLIRDICGAAGCGRSEACIDVWEQDVDSGWVRATVWFMDPYLAQKCVAMSSSRGLGSHWPSTMLAVAVDLKPGRKEKDLNTHFVTLEWMWYDEPTSSHGATSTPAATSSLYPPHGPLPSDPTFEQLEFIERILTDRLRLVLRPPPPRRIPMIRSRAYNIFWQMGQIDSVETSEVDGRTLVRVLFRELSSLDKLVELSDGQFSGLGDPCGLEIIEGTLQQCREWLQRQQAREGCEFLSGSRGRYYIRTSCPAQAGWIVQQSALQRDEGEDRSVPVLKMSNAWMGAVLEPYVTTMLESLEDLWKSSEDGKGIVFPLRVTRPFFIENARLISSRWTAGNASSLPTRPAGQPVEEAGGNMSPDPSIEVRASKARWGQWLAAQPPASHASSLPSVLGVPALPSGLQEEGSWDTLGEHETGIAYPLPPRQDSSTSVAEVGPSAPVASQLAGVWIGSAGGLWDDDEDEEEGDAGAGEVQGTENDAAIAARRERHKRDRKRNKNKKKEEKRKAKAGELM